MSTGRVSMEELAERLRFNQEHGGSVELSLRGAVGDGWITEHEAESLRHEVWS